jgi:hypothetical protein
MVVVIGGDKKRQGRKSKEKQKKKAKKKKIKFGIFSLFIKFLS